MPKYACCVDQERLNSSIEALSDIENCINTRDLSSGFLEIEEIIKNINFDHNNCIDNYKDKINYIIEEINSIKRKVNSLTNSLNKTVLEFSNADEFSTKDVESIFGNFDNKTDVELLATNNNLKVANNVSLFNENIDSLKASIEAKDKLLINEIGTSIAEVSKEGINTVPIGLGIGAAGVAGAIGAVVVDAKKNRDNTTYEEDVEEEKDTKEIEESYEVKKSEDVPVTPYFANRDSNLSKKFYDDIK